MGSEDGLCHQKRAAIVRSHSKAENRLDPACSRENLFADTPPSAVRGVFVGAPLYTKEMEEPVLCFLGKKLLRIASESGCAEVFKDQVAARIRRGWGGVQAIAGCGEIGPAAVHETAESR